MVPNITIMTGHYGSGKTEHAINLAMAETKRFDHVILIDLDVVNPFYRSSEMKHILNQAGITLVAPNFVHNNVDVPSLPPEVNGALTNKAAKIIIDVGGDDMGAKVLGVYRDYFTGASYEMLMVFNTRRYQTQNATSIIAMIDAIEHASKLSVSGIVANTNLGEQTQLQHVFEGIDIGIEVAKKTDKPLSFVGVYDDLLWQYGSELQERTYDIDMIYRPIKRYLTSWQGRS